MSLELVLPLITLVAAVVNGALGHGFSSITVPVALLFSTSRILNPVLVLVEVAINGYVLFISRRSVRVVVKRVWPIAVGLGPGIAGGAYLLSVLDPARLKLFVFAGLLPLILLQAAGVRRSVRAERGVGVPFGGAVGVLYAMTTVSGPPLALMFNNQGLVKQEFRAALAVIRLAESSLTAVAYVVVGLYTVKTGELLWSILPSVLIGVPLGAVVVRRLDAETFRRICMSFDAWIVGFGLSRALIEQAPATELLAYGMFVAVILIDAHLLRRFFRGRQPRRSPVVAVSFARPAGVAR